MRFAGTEAYVATEDLKLAVNAAIQLQKPLLIKGEPGTGKTLLAEQVAQSLGLKLIQWHIKSTTKAQQGLMEDDGEFFLESTAEDVGANVLRLGQALTRVHDLTFLNRARAESTFYEDLREKLEALVGSERLTENYFVPNVPNGRDYPVDYFVHGGAAPLYLFGVPNRAKARHKSSP